MILKENAYYKLSQKQLSFMNCWKKLKKLNKSNLNQNLKFLALILQ